jgi:hypothetical protein
MRTRLLATALSASLVLAGGALAGAAEEDGAIEEGDAIEFSLLFTDAEGDATAFVIDDVTPTSEDTLDLIAGEIGYDHESETVVFRIGVLDLTELPPAGALGKTFYVNFGYGSERYFVTATDHVVEGASFGFGTFNETGLRTGLTAATVTGEFLYDEDVVEIRLASEELLNAVPDAAPFAPGVRIASTDVLAQRYIGSRMAGGATPTADTAVARTFTIPEPPVAEEEGGEVEDDVEDGETGMED